MKFEGFNKRFVDELSEEIAVIEAAVFNGDGVATFEEYKRLVGKRNGLVKAKTTYQELVTLMEQANDS